MGTRALVHPLLHNFLLHSLNPKAKVLVLILLLLNSYNLLKNQTQTKCLLPEDGIPLVKREEPRFSEHLTGTTRHSLLSSLSSGRQPARGISHSGDGPAQAKSCVQCSQKKPENAGLPDPVSRFLPLPSVINPVQFSPDK